MANECNIMDTVVGDLLPHIYCKKVILENHSTDPENMSKATLLLELYEEREKLNNAGWLTSASTGGFVIKPGEDARPQNILDSLYIQYHVITESSNLEKLKPGNDPEYKNSGNVYVIKRKYPEKGYHEVLSPTPAFSGNLQISTSSLLGDFKKSDVSSFGKMREEYKNGKWYYVIPYELSIPFSTTTHNLGIVFYSYLNLKTLFPDTSTWEPAPSPGSYDSDPYIQSLNLEGTVNTEVILEGGSLAKTREAFIAPGGLLWEGSAHYHGLDNPGPGAYKGWMVGSEHRYAADQPKLQLLEVPNTKISDFRDSSIIMPGGKEDPIVGAGPNYKKAEGIINGILSPFQKEKKRDFIFDNDDEYSKLYLSRDKKNNAHGLFFINFKNLLQNNSSLYSILGSDYQQFGLGDEGEVLREILQESKILEMKLYRDRVLPVNLTQPYKKFMNGKIYEEPSRLIGRMYDVNGYKTSRASYKAGQTFIKETNLSPRAESYVNRYFVFSDYEVGSYDAGLYRYRVEISFIDGTFAFVNKLLNELKKIKLEIEQYYEFAISGRKTNKDFSYKMSYSSESATKVHFKPYYDDAYKSFNDEFLVDATYNFATKLNTTPIWTRASRWLLKTYMYFVDRPSDPHEAMNWGVNLNDWYNNMVSMLNPTSGSPAGIDFCIKMLDTMVTKIESIIGATKTEKNSNNLNNTSSGSDQSYLPIEAYGHKATTSKNIIYEEHSYDNVTEIFDATIHEGVYADYLSVGAGFTSVGSGLRGITPEYYQRRILLETAKFFSLGRKSLEDLNTPVPGDGNLINQAFGYLTPSAIKISDSAKTNKTFNFTQESFTNSAYTTFSTPKYYSGDALLSPGYSNYQNYDSMLISLINYKSDRKNNRNIDLATPPILLSDKPSLQEKKSLRRESVSRKLLEEMSITLHDIKKHDSFFDPRKPISEDTDDSLEFPLEKKNFSEALGLTFTYLKELLANKNQKYVKVPAGVYSYGPYNIDLPNNFKTWGLHQWDTIYANKSPSGAIKTLFSNPKDQKFNAFKFFNFNMTARIEVFTGTAGHPLKDLWQVCNPAHITSLGESDVLFCRIKYYDIKLLGGLDMPIADEYFMIHHGAALSAPPQSLAEKIITLSSVVAAPTTDSSNSSFLIQQANIKLKGVGTTLAKGVLPESYTSDSIVSQDVTPGPGGSDAGGGDMSGGSY